MTEHLDALTLNGWAEGNLAPEARARAAAHLAACAQCRALAAEQIQAAHMLLQLPAEPPPPLLAQTITAAVARRRRSDAAWRRLSTASAAAALLGLLLVAVAWPDVAKLLPAVAGAGVPLTGLTALVDLPAQTFSALASSTFDWASVLTEGAGAALLVGLALLTMGAFGGLAQLLRLNVA